MTKIVIVSPQGQLANRIIHFSHLIGLALEYDYKILHLCFDDFYPHFKDNFEMDEHENIRFLISRNKLLHLFRKLMVKSLRLLSPMVKGNFLFFHYIYLPGNYWLDVGYFQIDSDTFNKRNSKCIFFDGWEFRNKNLFDKHFHVIKKMFKPNEYFQSIIEDEVSGLKIQFDHIIGVHIRRGDYIHFLGGKYYYKDEIYIKEMDRIRNSELYKGKKLVFVICSDDRIDTDAYMAFDISYKRRLPIQDLYLLASCECITGPPSTFSYWASIYGQIPLIRILPE